MERNAAPLHHGFGPVQAADAPDPTTKQAQLNRAAQALNLDGSAFIDYWPAPLSGNDGPFPSYSGEGPGRDHGATWPWMRERHRT